jgi:hypothetical protein
MEVCELLMGSAASESVVFFSCHDDVESVSASLVLCSSSVGRKSMVVVFGSASVQFDRSCSDGCKHSMITLLYIVPILREKP